MKLKNVLKKRKLQQKISVTVSDKAPDMKFVKMHLQLYRSSIHVHDRMLHMSCTAEQIGALLFLAGMWRMRKGTGGADLDGKFKGPARCHPHQRPPHPNVPLAAVARPKMWCEWEVRSVWVYGGRGGSWLHVRTFTIFLIFEAKV